MGFYVILHFARSTSWTVHKLIFSYNAYLVSTTPVRTRTPLPSKTGSGDIENITNNRGVSAVKDNILLCRMWSRWCHRRRRVHLVEAQAKRTIANSKIGYTCVKCCKIHRYDRGTPPIFCDAPPLPPSWEEGLGLISIQI